MKNLKFTIAIVVLSAVFCAYPYKIATAESFVTANETARCAIPPFNEAYNSAEAVFVGKVLSKTKNGDVKTFEFEVEKYWKGADKKKIKITVYETPRFQAWFRIGDKYLVYAVANGGELNVKRCSRSNEAEDASEDLKKLGAGKNPV